MDIIAKIEMTPQTLTWYDALTNIYLTNKQPQADVMAHMNLCNIRKGIQYGSIRAYEGIDNLMPNNNSDIFDSDNYYTKTEADTIIIQIAEELLEDAQLNGLDVDFGSYTEK